MFYCHNNIFICIIIIYIYILNQNSNITAKFILVTPDSSWLAKHNTTSVFFINCFDKVYSLTLISATKLHYFKSGNVLKDNYFRNCLPYF